MLARLACGEHTSSASKGPRPSLPHPPPPPSPPPLPPRCDGVCEPLGLTETLPDAEWLLVRDALAEVVWLGVTVALLLPDKDLLCDWLREGDVDGDAMVLGVGVVVVDGV